MLQSLKITRDTLRSDIAAGVVNAVTSIPDALGSAVLAGLNPIHGLYAIMVGTPAGALTTGSVFMNVSITSAMALAVGDALAGIPEADKAQALITLTLMVGLVALVLGLLKLGTLTRFVSNAVMTGFLTGIAVLIVLGQLGDLTGFSSDYSNKLASTLDIILHFGQIQWPTLAIGLVTIALMLLLNRTHLANYGMLIAVVVGSAMAFLVNAINPGVVQVVGDIADIPRSIPTPSLPALSFVPRLSGSALAIAIIGLVQGAGVGRSYANPDGSYPDASQDFSGQGLANIAAGFFQGMPVGGSLSATAINISAGAQTRWANLSAGAFALAFVLLFAGIIELVAMPCVAALLIVAGFQAIDFAEIADVRDSGWMPRLVMVLTFAVTFFLPIQQAVFFGVIVSVLLFVYRAALHIRIFQLVPLDDTQIQEVPAPSELASRSVTALHFYGTTFFGAAYTLERMLPSPKMAQQAVVVLRLHGHEGVASTFIGVLERYAVRLQANDGKLMLSGVSETVWQRLQDTETTESIPHEDIYLKEDILGLSTRRALEAAEEWLAQQLAMPDEGQDLADRQPNEPS
jgi:SulP family sulfate permease